KKLDVARPEAYYNEAILTQEYRSKGSGDTSKTIEVLRQAITQYETFISRAGSRPDFKDAVKVSKDRIQDINDTLQFTSETERLRKEEEEMNKAAAAAAGKDGAGEAGTSKGTGGSGDVPADPAD
ncbi:MAG: hypothetical protein RJA70_2292, partial [Pseudomonadota bacterium]